MKSYINIENMTIDQNKVYTVSDIAKMTGLHPNTIRHAYAPEIYGDTCSPKTKQYVREVLEACHYDADQARIEATRRVKDVKHLQKRRTSAAIESSMTREQETLKMMDLRAKGYTNKEISKVCGTSINTVERRIGVQPIEFTMETRRLAGLARRLRREARETNQKALIEERNKKNYEEKVNKYKEAMNERQEMVEIEKEKWNKQWEAEQVLGQARKELYEVKEARRVQDEKILEFRKEAEKAADLIGVKFA